MSMPKTQTKTQTKSSSRTVSVKSPKSAPVSQPPSQPVSQPVSQPGLPTFKFPVQPVPKSAPTEPSPSQTAPKPPSKTAPKTGPAEEDSDQVSQLKSQLQDVSQKYDDLVQSLNLQQQRVVASYMLNPVMYFPLQKEGQVRYIPLAGPDELTAQSNDIVSSTQLGSDSQTLLKNASDLGIQLVSEISKKSLPPYTSQLSAYWFTLKDGSEYISYGSV